MVYSIASAYIEHFKITFLHETSIAIFAGFLVSFIAMLTNKSDFTKMVYFNESMFFYV